ncbi:hypothetical protein VTK26DRAFT_6468 [Humicola hyalothermophila]
MRLWSSLHLSGASPSSVLPCRPQRWLADDFAQIARCYRHDPGKDGPFSLLDFRTPPYREYISLPWAPDFVLNLHARTNLQAGSCVVGTSLAFASPVSLCFLRCQTQHNVPHRGSRHCLFTLVFSLFFTRRFRHQQQQQTGSGTPSLRSAGAAHSGRPLSWKLTPDLWLYPQHQPRPHRRHNGGGPGRSPCSKCQALPT